MEYSENKKRGRTRSIIFLVTLLLLVLLAIFFVVRAQLWGKSGEEAELLSIVNTASPLDKSYRPNLKKFRGVELDRRCTEDLAAMLADCEAAGFSPLITAGYTSREEQEERYAERVRWHVENGLSEEQAAVYALNDTFYPGTNEHELGLSVDIVDDAFRTANVKQAETSMNKWLSENCWNYGFIVRYPDGKTDVTGQPYSPWHFRYVGRDAAEKIYQLELTLEEYGMWFYSEDAIVVYS